MKRLTRWISSYYSISRTEANGFVILILLLFLASVGVFWMRSAPAESLEVDRHTLDSLLLVLEENINLDTLTYRPKFYKKPKQAAAAFPSNSQRTGRNSTYEPKPYIKKVIARFDINEADTTQLKQLKGIGSVFSRRILKYRKLLGGFVTSDQLSEVYG
ncbi:MAG: helix-hairpin-helix domain-containing protein, partial [Bacteroidota bacterium]